jgi:gas vesicle protein
MMRLLRFVVGALLGALGVGCLVLILAPRSGAKTRRLVGDWLTGVWSEGQRAAEAKRLELLAHLEELKSPDR